MFCCLILISIINGRSLFVSAEKFKYTWKYEHKNTPHEIFYVVSVCMPRGILEVKKFRGNTGLMEIKVACFFWGRKKPIKVITCELTKILTRMKGSHRNSQSIDNVASADGI